MWEDEKMKEYLADDGVGTGSPNKLRNWSILVIFYYI